MNNQIFISTDEGAKRICCGLTRFYELIANGSFRTVKLGKRRLVDVASLEKFAASLQDESGKGK